MPDSQTPMPVPTEKLMAANRSEIAIRIFRAATELGLRTVAIYAQEDRLLPAPLQGRRSLPIGAGKGTGRRLSRHRGHRRLAKEKGVDAIHPGLRISLGEPGVRARLSRAPGITFVGPRPELLELLGDKTAARALAATRRRSDAAGHRRPGRRTARGASRIAEEIGFPLIIKAAFGGGGRGMRVVDKASRPRRAARGSAGARPARAFGNAAVFLERYIRAREAHRGADPRRSARQRRASARARLLGAAAASEGRRGRAGGRARPESVRHELCDAAVRLAQDVGYDNAGTVEFLVDRRHATSGSSSR